MKNRSEAEVRDLPGNWQHFVRRKESKRTNREVVRTNKGRRGGCTPGCVFRLLVFACLIGASWMIWLRPSLHSLVQSKIESALSNAVNQIPAFATELPAGIVVQIQESAMNTQLSSFVASSDTGQAFTLQRAQVNITPGGLELDLQVRDIPGSCSITATPALSKQQLIVTDVNVCPVGSLLLSSDEVTSLIDTYLSRAQRRLGHTIEQVTLTNHELDLLIGPAFETAQPQNDFALVLNKPENSFTICSISSLLADETTVVISP